MRARWRAVQKFYVRALMMIKYWPENFWRPRHDARASVEISESRPPPKEKIHFFENSNADIFGARARKFSKIKICDKFHHKFCDFEIFQFVCFPKFRKTLSKLVNFEKMVYFRLRVARRNFCARAKIF